MLSLVFSLSHTGHWKVKKIYIVLHKDGVGYNKIAKTLKLSWSTVAKTIERFNRTGSTLNRPHHC